MWAINVPLLVVLNMHANMEIIYWKGALHSKFYFLLRNDIYILVDKDVAVFKGVGFT